MCCGNSNLSKRDTQNTIVGICKVCELVDNDISTKEVAYCGLCEQYICNDCMPKIFKRGWASFVNLIK